ncbi:MAG: beta-lactamase family protein [Sneathiellales bacterium]|nr:beta-lactamase family protein [Sneathiellales bacterium]
MANMSGSKSNRRSFFRICLLLTGTFFCLAAYPVSSAESLSKEKLALFAAEIDFLHDYLRIAGLATALYRKDKLLWFKGSGYADLQRKKPVTLDTPFHLASLTKTYAATVILQQVDAGKLQLDQPVSSCGVKIRQEKRITIRHLLSHTSHNEPGEAYRYDGAQFARLDTVLENCTGHSFEYLLKHRILTPLALQQTGKMGDVFSPPLAKPYKLDRDNRLVEGKYQDYFGSSAGIIASIADYAGYIAGLRSGKLLPEKQLNLLFTPTRSTKGYSLPYALGWFVETINGETIVWHYGYWSSVSTLVLIVPQQDLVFLAFANTDALSRGFNLGKGRVSSSPLAAAFIDLFLFRE